MYKNSIINKKGTIQIINNDNNTLNIFAIITNKNNIVNNFKDIVFYNNLTDINNILSLNLEDNILSYDLTNLSPNQTIYLGISYDNIIKKPTDFDIIINDKNNKINFNMLSNETLCLGKICKINNNNFFIIYDTNFLLYKSVKYFIKKYFPGIVYM